MMGISYSTMAKYTFYAVFLLSIGISTTSGGLVNSPSDQNATVGQRVTFFCTTNLDLPVYWYLNHTHEIFYGGRVSMSYKDVYEVDSTNKGEYNLIIASANESNNGEYTCGDDEGQGEKKSARLHVTAPISTTEAEPGESTESVRKLTIIIVTATVVGIGLLVTFIIACVLIRRRLRDRPQPIVMKTETRDGPDNKEENDGLLNENPQQGPYNKDENDGLLDENPQQAPNNKEENDGLLDENPQQGPNNKEENVGIRDENRQPGRPRPQPTLKKAETRDGPDNKKENHGLLDENLQQGSPDNKKENDGLLDENLQQGPNNKEEKDGLRHQSHEPDRPQPTLKKAETRDAPNNKEENDMLLGENPQQGSSSQGIVPSPKMSTNPPPASAVQNANTDDEAEKAAPPLDLKALISRFETPPNKDSNTQGAAGVTVKPQPLSPNPSFLK